MSYLKAGTKLKSVYWANGDFTVDKSDVESITVSMEAGQMAMVPWALVKYAGERHLVNLALGEGVILEKEE